MVICELLQIPVDKALAKVEPECYYRGTLVIAEDRRREYIIISQSARGVQTAIEELCNQTISKSSLHESCRREHRKGVTGGWSIARLERDAAIVHWNSRKGLFTKRVVAAWRDSAWHFK